MKTMDSEKSKVNLLFQAWRDSLVKRRCLSCGEEFMGQEHKVAKCYNCMKSTTRSKDMKKDILLSVSRWNQLVDIHGHTDWGVDDKTLWISRGDITFWYPIETIDEYVTMKGA